MRKTRILLVALAASLVLLAGSAVAQDASINTEAQTIEEGGTVTIDSLEIDEDGWVAVYEESVTGGPDFDSLVGVTEVESGSESDLEIETEIEEDGFYYAVLHYDESASSEFDYPDDPVVGLNGSEVQDYMFVVVGTGEEYQAYADANQQRRDLQEQLTDLQDQVDDFERRGEDEYEDEIQNLRDEIQNIQDDIEDLDGIIQDREELLQQLEEAEEQAEGDGSDGGETDGEGDGNGTEGDGTDGNGTENGTDGEGTGTEEPEGLPGFTVVAALVALLTGGALLRRDNE